MANLSVAFVGLVGICGFVEQKIYTYFLSSCKKTAAQVRLPGFHEFSDAIDVDSCLFLNECCVDC